MNNEEKILDLLGQVIGRLDRLETDVSGLKAGQAEMKATLTRIAVTQENVVLPRIQMALESHSELKREIDTLATKEQVEKLAGDVDVIKTVVTQHSREISKLKKAQ